MLEITLSPREGEGGGRRGCEEENEEDVEEEVKKMSARDYIIAP